METAFESTATTQAQEDCMADDDIQRLLLEAEERLRATKTTNNDTDALVPSVPKLLPDTSLKPYVRQQNDVATADPSARIPHDLKKDGASTSELVKVNSLKGQVQKKEKPTAGDDWFNLPKTEVTPELKRDLQMLRMRSVLDPKRHYKKENGKFKVPTYSQVGTIIEGPTEFFSGRIAKKDRKKTFVEEAMVLERETRRFESKYRDIQSAKQSGKKAYYNKLRAKRNTRGK
ncbi:Fcf2 pre-rRNA processing-domain-containing protein [Aspergillus floccosus]